jgi:hypothetical protein
VQRGGGGAEWRGLGSADSKVPGGKKRVKFLIQAEILGLSALRSVIGADFHTHKKLPSICSRVRLIISNLFELCHDIKR